MRAHRWTDVSPRLPIKPACHRLSVRIVFNHGRHGATACRTLPVQHMRLVSFAEVLHSVANRVRDNLPTRNRSLLLVFRRPDPLPVQVLQRTRNRAHAHQNVHLGCDPPPPGTATHISHTLVPERRQSRSMSYPDAAVLVHNHKLSRTEHRTGGAHRFEIQVRCL